MDETTVFRSGLVIAVQLIPVMLWALRVRLLPTRRVRPAYLPLRGQAGRDASIRYCAVTRLP